jgi:hypothetical protein
VLFSILNSPLAAQASAGCNKGLSVEWLHSGHTRTGGAFLENPMERTTENQVIALLVMLGCLIALGRMDQLEAEKMEQGSVQVAQK